MDPAHRDARGKTFEVLLGKALTYSGEYPQHFRSYDSSPEVLIEKWREELDDDVILRVEEDSLSAAELIKIDMPYVNWSNTIITWTSNPSDHEKLTGIVDHNTTADLFVSSDGNHYGLSAKYGVSTSDGAYSLTRMEEEFKITGLNDIYGEHQNYIMNETPFIGDTFEQRHIKFKEYRDSSPGSSQWNIAREAYNKTREFINRMSSVLASQLSLKSRDDMIDILQNMFPYHKTVYPLSKVWAKPRKTKPSKISVINLSKGVEKIIGFDRYEVDNKKIFGIAGDNRVEVAQIWFKTESGVVKGIVGQVRSKVLK